MIRDDDDITKRYHKGNPASQDAHKAAQHSKSKHIEIIMTYFRSRGSRGATCYQLELATGIDHQTASARCTELKTDRYECFLVPVLNPDGSHKRGPAKSGPTRGEMWMASY